MMAASSAPVAFNFDVEHLKGEILLLPATMPVIMPVSGTSQLSDAQEQVSHTENH